MKKNGIIAMRKGVYRKIKDNSKISNHKKSEVKNENNVIVDELGRIQLERKILNKMGIKPKDKLEIYVSDRNVILNKTKSEITQSRKTKIYIVNKYEIKIEISKVDFNTNHKMTTVDELGRMLILYEVREQLGIIENDKLKVYIKDDMIILTPKKKY